MVASSNFDERWPNVTVIDVSGNARLQVKTPENDGYSALQIGLAEFQEGGLHALEAARPRQFPGYRPHGLVGGFDAGAVGKNHDRRAHALPWMYARM